MKFANIIFIVFMIFFANNALALRKSRNQNTKTNKISNTEYTAEAETELTTRGARPNFKKKIYRKY